MATGDEQGAEHLPPHLLNSPHDNWEFNILLDKLAQNIDDEELKRLKYFEYGPGGIRKKLFEEIKTAHDFFIYLQESTILSVDNVVHLQAMLWHLDRKDLVKECAQYAATVPNILYFHQPSPVPVNGYRYAAFHVEGKDLRNYKREDLEKLRNILSRLLGVPREFIIISGLTPSKSLVITVMIPECNADFLVELLQGNRFAELAELGIDSVLINDQTFIINEQSSVFTSEERNETAELVEKLEKSQSLLEQCNIDLLRLRKKLQFREESLRNYSSITERNLMKVTNDMSELLRMQKELLTNGHMQEKTLQTESALAYFRFAMNKVKESGHDTDEVLQLLEANTYFISSKTRDSYRHVLRKLIEKVEGLKLIWVTQMFEDMMSRLALRKNKQQCFPESEIRLRNKHGLPTGLPTRLDDLRLLSQIAAAVKKNTSELLRRYSLELSDKDIAKLRIGLPYDWTTQENNLVESDHGEFLELVLKKELLKQGEGSEINMLSFLPPLFEKIGRKDLATKFIDERARLQKNDTNIEIDMRISLGEPNKGASREKSTREEDNPKENSEIKKSLERIEKMMEELHEKRNLPDSQKKLFESILFTQPRYMDF